MQYIAARALAGTLDPFYRRWTLNATSWFVAIQGDLPSLQWLVESYLPNGRLSAAVYAAAANGHVGILEWLHKFHRERVYWNCIEMCGALDYGHGDAVQWLRVNSPPRPESLKLVVRSAAKTGNLAAVRWLYNDCHAPAEDALVHAQKGGRWETARWILVNCDLAVRRVKWDAAAASVAANGNIEVAQWLYENRSEVDARLAMKEAILHARFEIVVYLHSKGWKSPLSPAQLFVAQAGNWSSG
ncbi:Ankyrin repeat and SAM domain-containing protein 3 [Phytophthora pseudosyringae]|uniref:Ankyrin repeat and SAM domain-containing protein 3 n=1 Tax=Phytophthora pseudosyringae TaxID=221518 RepID=A0A8T1WDZ6_9STRA|nr:Ankyrin repeat and SAM domain-containing protein 3 [Phytophthora pseudosyringae]